IGERFEGSLDELALYRRVLAPREISALAAKAPPLRDGLLAWWNFDTAETTDDVSGGGHRPSGKPEPSCIRTVLRARENGIMPLGIFFRTAHWASTAPPKATYRDIYPPNDAAWREYIENTARHLTGVIDHWEIWNEPNSPNFWRPPATYSDLAREQGELLASGYRAAKRGNPGCSVLTFGHAGPKHMQRSRYYPLDTVLNSGGSTVCDAISIHPYPDGEAPEDSLVEKCRYLADITAQYGPRRPIWITEMNWTTELPQGSGTPKQTSEHRQADMIARYQALMSASGLVDKFFIFRMQDPGKDKFYGEETIGLCYNDMTPKDSYFAHRASAIMLDDASFERSLDAGDLHHAYAFKKGSGERFIALWVYGRASTTAVKTGTSGLRVMDIMGNERTVKSVNGVSLLDAGESILYLRSVPDGTKIREVLSAPETHVRPGVNTQTAVQMLNPFGQDAVLSLQFSASDSTITIADHKMEKRLAPNERTSMNVAISSGIGTKPGIYTITAIGTLLGQPLRTEFPVRIRVSEPADGKPVGHWTMDDASETSIADSSGNGAHGSIRSAVRVEGKRGMALKLDGTSVVTIPNTALLNPRDELTIALWVRMDEETSAWVCPLSKSTDKRQYGFWIHPKDMSTVTLYGEASAAPYYAMSLVPIRTFNEWHHLAFTISTHTRRWSMYLNGTLCGEDEYDRGLFITNTAPIILGDKNKCTIDDVRIYSCELTKKEVELLARSE
ncbi:MAG: LamG-like jellyroll fold domain-containing protein, partial [Spirochaetota bacterium]